jgi:hypothetical protein
MMGISLCCFVLFLLFESEYIISCGPLCFLQ